MVESAIGGGWHFIWYGSALFADANQLLDDFYDTLFDGEFNDVVFDESDTTDTIQQFANERFSAAFVQLITWLKQEGAFAKPLFSDDVLLGLQYGDPSRSDLKLALTVSAQVNSTAWHAKLEQCYALWCA